MIVFPSIHLLSISCLSALKISVMDVPSILLDGCFIFSKSKCSRYVPIPGPPCCTCSVSEGLLPRSAPKGGIVDVLLLPLLGVFIECMCGWMDEWIVRL